MNRLRVPIAGLIAAVAVVAVNLAVMRAYDPSSPHALPHLFFACGVLPMASLLIAMAVMAAVSPRRGGRISPFLFGFEVSGGAVVFAFLACYSIATPAVLSFAEATAAWFRAAFLLDLEATPEWLLPALEFGFATALFSLPQLLLALIGGWLIGRMGLIVRFERQGVAPAAPSTRATGAVDTTTSSLQRARSTTALGQATG